jgi:predicted dehydrogenase
MIGCGMQGELRHLPAVAQSDHFEASVLVDKSPARAQKLAQKYNVPTVLDDFRDVAGRVDAALVVLPNYLHGPVAAELLRQGIHVLVEKPMALNIKQCDEMLDAARANNKTLAVGMDFRFPHTSQLTQRILHDRVLGTVIDFDLRMGQNLSSISVESDYLLRKETAGGGVLMDLAVHALDLVLWWLGDYEHVQYYDDSMGGVEANCELHLRLRSGAVGVVESSRVRRLRNTCIIKGDRATLEVGLWDLVGQLRLEFRDQKTCLSAENTRLADIWPEVFCRQLDDFGDSIIKPRAPFVPGTEGRRSIELIEDCYGSRKQLHYPWLIPNASTSKS